MELPALSEQEPDTDALPLSGPLYVRGDVHPAMPDVASVPGKLTESAWLYQPPASVAREGAGVSAGAVLSTLNVFETVVIPPSLEA